MESHRTTEIGQSSWTSDTEAGLNHGAKSQCGSKRTLRQGKTLLGNCPSAIPGNIDGLLNMETQICFFLPSILATYLEPLS